MISYFQISNQIKYLPLFFIFILRVNSYGQIKLTGTYCLDYKLKDFNDCFTFLDNAEFKHIVSGDLGVLKQGEGEYKIENNLLTLKYNKTKVEYSGYHKTAYWKTDKDSISLKFRITNLKGIKNKSGVIFLNKKGVIIDSLRGLELKIKKSNSRMKVLVNSLGFETYIFELKLDKNYDIQVYLNEGNRPEFIKDKTVKYQIIKQVEKGVIIRTFFNDKNILWEIIN